MSLRFKSKSDAWKSIIDASDLDGHDYSKADHRYNLYQHYVGDKPVPWRGSEMDCVNDEVGVKVSGPMEAFFLLTRHAKEWPDVIEAVRRLRGIPGMERLRLPDKVIEEMTNQISYWHNIDLMLCAGS